MRLRTLCPSYLDSKWLVALRRETLLAKNVLLGNTHGYRQHPQLLRFKDKQKSSLKFIDTYLRNIYREACNRWYTFDKSKFWKQFTDQKIDVTYWQLLYERNHLLKKLQIRDVKRYWEYNNKNVDVIKVNSIFQIISWNREPREKIS